MIDDGMNVLAPANELPTLKVSHVQISGLNCCLILMKIICRKCVSLKAGKVFIANPKPSAKMIVANRSRIGRQGLFHQDGKTKSTLNSTQELDFVAS